MPIIVLLALVCTFIFSGIAHAERILLIPLDNRPVCYEYVVDTISKAGFEIKTPPAEMLPSGRQLGDTVGMLNWLEQEAPKANAVVMSTDALIYGGLVGSRTHQMSATELDNRVQQMIDTVSKLHIKVYAYSTIMRTPKTNTGRTEPPYYATYGAQIFRYSQLQDMSETIGLNAAQSQEYADLMAQIPAEDLNDWNSRRAKNLKVNEMLLQATKEGKFNYFIIGKDDTAQFSASHRDARTLAQYAKGIGKHQYGNFVGADQLGMVLCMRAIADYRNKMPYVYTKYNQGVGANTVPTYEDGPVGETVKAHIWALGGYPTNFLDRADLVLMVNTPINGKTLEASSAVNSDYNLANKPQVFLRRSQGYMNDGYPVAIGDVAYGNGGDNALVQAIFNNGMQYTLAAYAGWNTASNTLGYALVQGLLAKDMSANNKQTVILVRYTDDWAYQANVRGQIYNSVIYPQGLNGQDLGTNTAAVQTQVQTALRNFMSLYPIGIDVNSIDATLPWDRMFEVYVRIRN